MIDILKVQKFLNDNYPLDSDFKLKEDEFDQLVFLYTPLALIKTLGLQMNCTPEEFDQKYNNALNNLSVGTSLPIVPLIRVQVALNKIFEAPASDSLSLFSTNLLAENDSDGEDYANQALDQDFSLRIRDLVKPLGLPDTTPLKNAVKMIFSYPTLNSNSIKGDSSLSEVADNINYTLSSNYACQGFYSTYGNMDVTGTKDFHSLLPYFAANYQYNANKPVTGYLVHSDFLGDYQASTWGLRTGNVEFLIRWLLYLKGYTFELDWNAKLIEDLHTFVADSNVNFYFQDSDSMWTLISALIKPEDKPNAYLYKNGLQDLITQQNGHSLYDFEFDGKTSFNVTLGGIDFEVGVEVSRKEDKPNSDNGMPYNSILKQKTNCSVENNTFEFDGDVSPTVNFDWKTWKNGIVENLANKITHKLEISGATGSISLFATQGIDSSDFSLSAEVGIECELNVTEIMHQESTKPFEVTFTVSTSLADLHNYFNQTGNSVSENNIKNNGVAYALLGLLSVIHDGIQNGTLSLYPSTTGHVAVNGNAETITATNHNLFEGLYTGIGELWQNPKYRDFIVGASAVGIVVIITEPEIAPAMAEIVKILAEHFFYPALV